MNRLYYIVAKCVLIMSITAIQLKAYGISADANYLFVHSETPFRTLEGNVHSKYSMYNYYIIKVLGFLVGGSKHGRRIWG
jgi:hypothetical protein